MKLIKIIKVYFHCISKLSKLNEKHSACYTKWNYELIGSYFCECGYMNNGVTWEQELIKNGRENETI
jgi:hypothetical protein